jgi:hypothetical protein
LPFAADGMQIGVTYTAIENFDLDIMFSNIAAFKAKGRKGSRGVLGSVGIRFHRFFS